MQNIGGAKSYCDFKLRVISQFCAEISEPKIFFSKQNIHFIYKRRFAANFTSGTIVAKCYRVWDVA